MLRWLLWPLEVLDSRRRERELKAARAAGAARWNAQRKLTRGDIENNQYAVAVFTAIWDGSWGHYAPIVHACAEKYGTRLKVGFFDTDTDDLFVRELKLANVPTIGFFRHGQVVALHLGYNLNLSEMAEFLLANQTKIPPRIVKQQRRVV